MAHHILLDKCFVAARGGPAWHKLGTVAREDQDWSCDDCLYMGDMDVPYSKHAIEYTTPSGLHIVSQEQFIVLRHPMPGDDSFQEMGIVGAEYVVAQNRDLARGMDRLCKATGWKPETVGLLGKGETLFITVKTGERSIFGDKYTNYVGLIDGKANARALTLKSSDVRMVCANTVAMAESAQGTTITLSHGKDVMAEFDWWIGALGDLQRSQDETFARLQSLAEHKITEEQARTIFERAYPMPKKSDKQAVLEGVLSSANLTAVGRMEAQDRIDEQAKRLEYQHSLQQERRDAAMLLYRDFNKGQEMGVRQGRTLNADTLKIIAHTGYAAYQSVCELTDWGGRDGKAAVQSALFGEGSRCKIRAAEAAEELIKSL